MLIAAMIGAGGLGVAIERFAYRPLRNAPRIAPLITALGVSFFLQNSGAPALRRRLPQLRHLQSVDLIERDPRGAAEHLDRCGSSSIVSAFALMIVLTLLVSRSQLGKAMRATSFDREAASMMGIDVDRVIVVDVLHRLGARRRRRRASFGLVFYEGLLTYGLLAGLKGFTAAVVGGIGSIPGAMLGGLLIGLAEAFTDGIPARRRSRTLIVFAILIAIMLVRPTGLFGPGRHQKV